ncbi:MAG TPA: hypothetical protein VLE23_12210 [Geminicoccaceae bacterium]|nr:hypothetical protein [Geminicoccaceae bacterium]
MFAALTLRYSPTHGFVLDFDQLDIVRVLRVGRDERSQRDRTWRTGDGCCADARAVRSRRDRTATLDPIIRLTLVASFLAPIGAALAEPASGPACPHSDQNCGQAPPLDQLSLTIGRLKDSLSSIRRDLEAADQAPGAPLDRLCLVPLAEAQAARDAAVGEREQARAAAAGERTEWKHAEAALTDELVSLRGRLATAAAEVARLTGDRATLASHTVELDEAPEPGAGAVAGSRAEPWRTSPILSAEAVEIEGAPEPARPPWAAQHDPPAGALLPPRAAAADDHAPDRLQLQAELALAQLKIAELSSALESARLRHEAMEAELGTLRSLTDAKIRQLLGWN